jgi:hypothetical protein
MTGYRHFLKTKHEMEKDIEYPIGYSIEDSIFSLNLKLCHSKLVYPVVSRTGIWSLPITSYPKLY